MWEGFEIFQTRRRNFLSRPSCGQEAWSRDVRGNCANIRAAKKISIVFFFNMNFVQNIMKNVWLHSQTC